ncbi:glutathione S-transferase [Parashewanella curva]|uniref:Glutathione S-transferase n=1 Tax=Parashewanella curva TaxID=2338552 RepID=A0A3L8PY67_9GAMM|nr:glutathione S-transferase N-terminal domain-containing protein [Parashewanella curva]RLV60205.1 glutathione S-transferase [Parashewanella curva]
MATLLYSNASPYARLPRILLHHFDITDIQAVISNPFENQDILICANPLAKIPCLVFDDETGIYDSEVICRYLDATYGGKQLFSQLSNWSQHTQVSMLKGLIDSTVGLRQEQMREEEGVRSPFWTERFEKAILRTTLYIEKEAMVITQSNSLTIQQILLVTALDYIEFRFPDLDWVSHCPKLDNWFKSIRNLACFEQTRPC